MKVLITGSAGFIGSALSLRLLERGDQVVGVDNLNDYYDVSLKGRAWRAPRTTRTSPRCARTSPIAPRWSGCSANTARSGW